MENISLEQIDLIMQRANVSYAEAKTALEEANGDILEALLLLEKGEKVKPVAPKSPFGERVSSLIDKLNHTNFILKKQQRIYVDVPLSIAIIAIILCFHVSLVALVLAFLFGVRIDIKGENEIAKKINSTLDSFK